MRKIVVTDDIKLLAKEYADGMIQGINLAAKPLDNLKKLKSDLLSNTTKLHFTAKQPNPKGRKKANFSAIKKPEYAKYIQEIIDNYDSLNDLLPWQYHAMINQMENILGQEALKVSVTIGKQNPYSFSDLIIKAMDYKGVREKVFPDYVRNNALDIKTCVYCNAQFAITAETEPALTPAMIKKRGKIRGRKPNPHPAVLRANYELDHNMPKSLYPYLCTNFYNLLPCCSSCNRHKSDCPLEFSLYAQAGEEIEPLYFELPPDDLVNFQTKHICKGLHVELHDKGDGTLAEDFNKRFAINAVYKEHSEEVRELLWRHKIYSPSAIQALKDSIPGLFADGFDIDRFVLGTYADPKEVFKRPLTIMKQDIKKQL